MGNKSSSSNQFDSKRFREIWEKYIDRREDEYIDVSNIKNLIKDIKNNMESKTENLGEGKRKCF